MKPLFFLVVAVIGTGLWAAPASADIDHLCLQQCIGTGSKPAECMQQCSYGADPAAAAPLPQNRVNDNNVKSNHDVLSAPAPVAGNEVLLSKKITPPTPSKDYSCFTQCLNSGNAYQLCEKRCTKADCPPNSTSCMGVTGVLNGVPVMPQH